MKPHLRSLIFVFVSVAMALPSCVSVKLSPEIKKSEDIQYTAPPPPFKEIDLKSADKAWKSSATGNTISFFSECSDSLLPLEKFRDAALASLTKSELLNSAMVEHDGREALQSLIEGKVEGIPMRISMLIYQKNSCSYSLSLSGRKDRFDQDLEAFAKFQEGFKAP